MHFLLLARSKRGLRHGDGGVALNFVCVRHTCRHGAFNPTVNKYKVHSTSYVQMLSVCETLEGNWKLADSTLFRSPSDTS